MEIVNKLPLELVREIISYDIHPVAELFKYHCERYTVDIEHIDELWGTIYLFYTS